MTPQELSDAIATTVRLAQDRVGPGSIGEQQYYDKETGEQQFESMPLDQLLEYATEEALDFINYGVMLHIRFARLRSLLSRTTDAGETDDGC